MDTSQPSPIDSPPSRSRETVIIASLVAIVVAAVFAWWLVAHEKKNALPVQNETTEPSAALGQIVATTSASVPATANPIPQATPAVNPVEKTNPFANEYHNPFQ